VVDRRHTVRRLDEDEPVHAVRDVHADRCGRAVIDVQAVIERLERELRLVTRRREGRSRAAARTGDAVQVDVVWHLRVGVIAQVELDRVAFAHADEGARHGAAEGPESVGDAFGDRPLQFLHFEVDDDLGRRVPARRRRHVRRRSELRDDRLALRRTEVASRRAARVRRLGVRWLLWRLRAAHREQQGQR
jgi:hypothetical protein